MRVLLLMHAFHASGSKNTQPQLQGLNSTNRIHGNSPIPVYLIFSLEQLCWKNR